jgi:DNA-binding MarR family transcriptional regulator
MESILREADEMAAVDSTRGPRQGVLLREFMIVHQLLATRLGRALRPVGLSLTHVSFLSHLAGTGARSSPSDIAEAMEVNQPAVSKTMKALEELGAITVEDDPTDARRRIVYLTDTGKQLLHSAQMAMHPAATAAFSSFNDEDLADLTGALARLRVTLDPAH